MSKPSAHDRLAQAAFDLFNERGYEQTTVDDIAERAGLGRATFFRHYRSKEDVIFPNHDRLLEQVRDRLRSTSHATALAAVSDAVRLVLLHYLDEGDLARRRYALTSTVPALRDREIVSVARYQRLFREYIVERMAGGESPGGEPAALQAELMAAAVASAHNHVLRRWLRGDSTDPIKEVDVAMRQVISLFASRSPGLDADGTTVVAFRTGQPLEALLPAIRQALEPGSHELCRDRPVPRASAISGRTLLTLQNSLQVSWPTQAFTGNGTDCRSMCTLHLQCAGALCGQTGNLSRIRCAACPNSYPRRQNRCRPATECPPMNCGWHGERAGGAIRAGTVSR